MDFGFSIITGITTSIKPTKKTLFFIQDLLNIIPNSVFFRRKNYKIYEIFDYFKEKKIKNCLILIEKKGMLSNLLQIDIQNKIYIRFNIKNITFRKNIYNKGNKTNHNPELIFLNFKGKKENILAFLFSKLFSNIPDFHGRQVLVFYLSKNLIFIRFYRYLFSVSGNDVRLQELGPRITLEFLQISNQFSDNFL